MDNQDQKFQGNCSWCGIYGHVARDRRKKTEYLQHNQTSGWSGTDDKGKGKPGTGKSKGKHDKGKGQGKNKNKGKGKHHGKKGKNKNHEMEGHDDAQDTQTCQNDTKWTDTSWDHADNWTDADKCSSDWSTDLWADPAREQSARHRRYLLKNTPIQCTEAAFQC